MSVILIFERYFKAGESFWRFLSFLSLFNCLMMATKSSAHPSKPPRKGQSTPKPKQREKDPVEVRNK